MISSFPTPTRIRQETEARRGKDRKNQEKGVAKNQSKGMI